MTEPLEKIDIMMVAEENLKKSYERGESVIKTLAETKDDEIILEPDTKLFGGFFNVAMDAAWYIRMGEDKRSDWFMWKSLGDEVREKVENKPTIKLVVAYFFLKSDKTTDSEFEEMGVALSKPGFEPIDWAMRSFEDYFSKANAYQDHSGAFQLCADIFSTCFANADLPGSVPFDDGYIPDGSYLSIAQLKEIKTYLDKYVARKIPERGNADYSERIQMGRIESQFSLLEINQQKTDLVHD